jgi:hypothetical protein
MERVAISESDVLDKIYLIRGKKVMLDRDLAELYGVETRVLNQAVKRNLERFPSDFMFQMTEGELENWISQFVMSKNERKGIRRCPYAFTELGVAMLSSVLKSERAIEVNIQIVRIFSRMREFIFSHKDVLLKLEQLEKHMMKQNDGLKKHAVEIYRIFEILKQLINPPQEPRKKIGFMPDLKGLHHQ